MSGTVKKHMQSDSEKIRTIAFVTDAVYSVSFVQQIISGVAEYMQRKRHKLPRPLRPSA